MSTIEDFKNAPVGATATYGRVGRAMKLGDGEQRWILKNGRYVDDKEMEFWGYTLDPLPESGPEPDPEPEPDWLDAHAVLARHVEHATDSRPSLWVNLGDGMWGHAETTKRAETRDLRDVTPLYPKGQCARPLPTRDEIAEALSVPDVHHPDYCDCGQPVCGGTCDVNGEDCFCAPERCPGLDQQIDAVMALLKGQDA